MIGRATAWVLIRLIRFYQVGISPLTRPSCRFNPTCSQYAIEVIRRDGAIRGSLRAIRRLLKCHPWNPGGHDPP